MSIRRPSPGTVLGSIALFVALGGTALAATGTLVNIADKTTASNIARVDATGALKTTATLSVPAKPLAFWAPVFDGDTGPVIPMTSATIAIDRIAGSVYSHSDVRRTIYFEQWRLPSDATSCASPTQWKTIAVYEIGPGAMAIDNPTTPIVLKPMSGSTKWCLVASAYQDGPTDGYFSYLSMSGFLVSGTLPTGFGTARPAARDDGSPRQPPIR